MLSDLNQILFAEKSKQCDLNLLMELDDNVTTARNQRLSFIMSCSNVSTLIGLLGTFCGSVYYDWLNWQLIERAIRRRR
ncbi:Putative integral membrane protein [Salmonella bongori]|nr:Putative integral membrane protein [Salmonella bongori]